jgi:hypothetical protein
MNNQLEELGLDRLVGSDTVMASENIKSPTTLTERIKAGTYPPPDRINGRLRQWFVSTIRKHQHAQFETAA